MQSDTRRRVFISYSHEPPENAKFVRDLAGRLRLAKFDVWLDEEMIPGAAHIEHELRKAIRESEIGLFIATSRWVEREWTQFEVKLFGMREESRRLVILREDVDLGDLGPHLIGLKNVRWLPEDEERDARFWEIYCGINNLPPGPREFWEQEGRRVASSHTNPAADAPTPTLVPGPNLRPGSRLSLPCTGRPVASVAGDGWTFIVTDHEEWVGVTPDGRLHPTMTRLSDHSTAAFSVNQELLVGMYEPMLARLRGERWEYLPQEAPILCFGTTPEGNVAGTAAGGLVLIDASSPIPVVRIRDPVAALASFDGGLIVVGSRGRFGRVLWPITGKDALAWINTDRLGRPVGLFGAVEYNHVGVYSATRLGILNSLTEQLIVCEQAIAQGIREVVFLGARNRPYAVLTEAGGLLLVDAGLSNVRAVRLPREAYVIGCCQAERLSRFHAWTHDGELYTVSEGAVESTAADGVVLAYYPNLSVNALHVVRWQPKTGATLEWLTLN
ncbi:MAG TPA: toll/interleukin-1 receptor domain-containing protein [Blastocatellia bacterium]|jgi:hypothetical protein|nr:toll/interleukin-1 receptor domain-containing protein [Blastocatellia bacterium]